MGEPQGVLIIPVGFNPSDELRSVTVDVNDYLHTVLTTGLTGGGMGEPVGKIAVACGYNPSGELRTVELDADDNLLITLLGGAANQILSSDGTKFGAITLADVIEAAILTADGDILIRSSGVAQRLAKPAVGEILGESGQIPAWITKPTTAYTEGAKVLNAGNITTTHGVFKVLTFDTELYDTDAIHSTSSNTSRLTCKTAGYYFIRAEFKFVTSAAGGRRIGRILLNGVTTLSYKEISGAGATLRHTPTPATIVHLAVDDYVEVSAFQDTGGNLDVYYAYPYTPVFMMQRIG